jgi:3D (Asp-Asp-Asp) domain-containing protein
MSILGLGLSRADEKDDDEFSGQINGFYDIYEVQDRTSKKYQYRVDIWFPSKEDALQWGK